MNDEKRTLIMSEVPVAISLRLSEDELAVLDELGELAGSRISALHELIPHLVKRALRGEIDVGIDLDHTVVELERSEIVRRMSGLATGQFQAIGPQHEG